MFHMPDRSPSSVHCGRYRPGNCRRRRGVAVFLVLLLITLTLALSYAAVRTQSMAFMVQRNSDRRAVAQQTAVTGMTMALKKMQNSSWAGFGSTLTGTLSTSESFTATYTFGDASLTSSSPDYNNYPFRGTISVTGKSIDPINPQSVTTYQISVVVRVVPRQLSTEPSDWNTMQPYTVYQTYSQPFEIDIPCQLAGNVRIQGALKIAPHYPDTPASTSWIRYLTDLNSMRSGGYSDYRPFTGPVSYVSGAIDGTNLTALTSYLHVSAAPLALHTANSDWVQPSGFSTYQIYPGGPTYTIPLVSNYLQSVTLGPDPMTNPLGIFYYNGDLTIKSNVTINGSLFCKGNLTLAGANICFNPVELPGLFGAGTSIRLPAIICNSLTVNNTVSSGSIKGLIAVFNTFKINSGSQLQSISIIGRIISKVFYINQRTEWDNINWSSYYSIYWTYYRNSIPYFPVYMNAIGLYYQPLLTINPDTTSITYHWPTPNASILAINSSDGALRWEIVKWTETP
jgi:Tfp pilus assembly protein PilX